MRWLPLLLLVGCILPDDDLDRDGFTVRDGDCNDLDPDIHPDAEDTVEDGIDQDCDGHSPVLRTSGVSHSCILDTVGMIVCDGLPSPDSERVWVELASGDNHSCALDVLGFVDCWGDNRSGQTDAPSGAYTSVGAALNYSTAMPVSDVSYVIPECWGDCPQQTNREEAGTQ